MRYNYRTGVDFHPRLAHRWARRMYKPPKKKFTGRPLFEAFDFDSHPRLKSILEEMLSETRISERERVFAKYERVWQDMRFKGPMPPHTHPSTVFGEVAKRTPVTTPSYEELLRESMILMTQYEGTFHGDCIQVVTPEVRLEDDNGRIWELGKYTIKVDSSLCVYVTQHSGNSFSSRGYIHPHVAGDGLCYGEGGYAKNLMSSTGHITDLIDLTIAVLNTYGEGPHQRLEGWDGSKMCDSCWDYTLGFEKCACGRILCNHCTISDDYCDECKTWVPYHQSYASERDVVYSEAIKEDVIVNRCTIIMHKGTSVYVPDDELVSCVKCHRRYWRGSEKCPYSSCYQEEQWPTGYQQVTNTSQSTSGSGTSSSPTITSTSGSPATLSSSAHSPEPSSSSSGTITTEPQRSQGTASA